MFDRVVLSVAFPRTERLRIRFHKGILLFDGRWWKLQAGLVMVQCFGSVNLRIHFLPLSPMYRFGL